MTDWPPTLEQFRDPEATPPEMDPEGFIDSVVHVCLDWSGDKSRVDGNLLDDVVGYLDLPSALDYIVVARLTHEGLEVIDFGSPSMPNRRPRESYQPLFEHELLTSEEVEQLFLILEEGRSALTDLTNSTDAPPSPAKRMQLRAVKRAEGAKEALIARNLKLVAHFARHYRRAGEPSLDVEDLAHEGVFGLIHAIDKFDIDRGFRLSTYASWWIKQSITRAIANERNLIRLPVHAFDSLAHANAIEREASERGKTLPDTVVAAEAGIPLGSLMQLRLAGADQMRLDDLLATGWDVAIDDPTVAIEGQIDDQRTLERVMEAMDALDARYRTILAMRFGFVGDVMTLEQTGRELGVTRERVRQLQSKIMDELRQLFENLDTPKDPAP